MDASASWKTAWVAARVPFVLQARPVPLAVLQVPRINRMMGRIASLLQGDQASSVASPAGAQAARFLTENH
jgi:hypothetical protein